MQDKVERLEEQLRKSHRCERARDETHAVGAIQTNYKYFFKYVKKRGTVNAAVGPLVNTDGEVINNPLQISIKEKTNKRCGKLCELGNYNKRALTIVVTQRMTSISYRGPTLFNALPRYVRDKECSSVDQFKRVLDRFLTNVPDQPKIPHYSIRALSNSIPDQLALMRADGNFMDSPPHDTLYPVPFTGEG
ncbi:hypothetical protein Pcinc_024896 [Petrolisthes cinctipes]|uniref:Uncharacterized protein n=2 Tax=Petrolisthes cinctipes TaxID=88211 RepID=A0AAE1FAA3_PETCI|nr:hypothetical protein Pcinc_024896 [Petrolisthes cinctipes]